MEREYLQVLQACPSCGKPMEVESHFLRVDQASGRRALERVLRCRACNVKIRQVVSLQ